MLGYEHLILDFDRTIEQLTEFMNFEVDLDEMEDMPNKRPSAVAALASSWQWANVCNTDEEFRKNQYQKWKRALEEGAMTKKDIFHIEMGCRNQLTYLGYNLFSEDLPDKFTLHTGPLLFFYFLSNN